MIPGLSGALCGAVIGICIASYMDTNDVPERYQDCVLYGCLVIGVLSTL